MTSAHYINDRQARERTIQKLGAGKPVAQFTVDRGHKDGPEKHVITDNAIIIIYNAISGKMITKLIARPGQIKRYYPDGQAPAELVAKAKSHQSMAYNRI